MNLEIYPAGLEVREVGFLGNIGDAKQLASCTKLHDSSQTRRSASVSHDLPQNTVGVPFLLHE